MPAQVGIRRRAALDDSLHGSDRSASYMDGGAIHPAKIGYSRPASADF